MVSYTYMKDYKSKKMVRKEKIVSKKRFLYVVALIAIGVFFYGYRCIAEKVCEIEVVNKFVRHDMTITMPNGVLVAEVVDTPASRELGLSGRSSMRDNEGMMFVFDHPGRYGFWMKDMLFPLDIVWINQNGVVVHIERNLSPVSYRVLPRTNPETFINTPDASYVLEVNAGRADEYGLYLGSKVKISE